MIGSTRQAQGLPLVSGVFARLRGTSDGVRAKRGALLAFGIRVASAGLAYLSQILLARWIGAFEFGIFAYVWVFVLVIGGLSTIGLNTSVLRFLPEYREGGHWALYRGFILSSRLLVTGVATVCMAAGIAVTWALNGTIDDYYLVPLVIVFFCLPGYALTDLQDGMARSESWIDLALVPPYIQRPLLLVVLMAVAIGLGFEANAVTALSAALVATYVTAFSQFVLMERRLAKLTGRGPREYRVPMWVMVSAPILMVESFFLLLQHVDVLVLNAFVTPSEVAVYYAAIKTTSLVAFVRFSIVAGYSARFSEYYTAGRFDDLASHVREAVKWSFWPSVLATGAMLACGLPLLWLFGPEFTAGYPVMFVFAVGLMIRAALGPAEMLLTVLGHQNACAGVMFLALAVNIGMNLILIPHLGAIGAATATVVAIAVESLLLFSLVKRRLGLHAFVFGASARS